MRHAIALSLSLLCVGLSGQAAALSSDRSEPMYIEADRADIDDQRGVSVYRGNVQITQGTLQLKATELTVHSKGGDIIKAIAVGQPATYRQRPDGKAQDIEAEALRMEYFAAEEKLILIDKAEVRQGGDTFRSERINYDIAKDVVNAGASVPGDRVRIRIQPKAAGGAAAGGAPSTPGQEQKP